MQWQKSLKRELFDAECAFTEIVEEVVEFLNPPADAKPTYDNPARAFELYCRLIDWKFNLSDRLRVENAVLPANILLQ